MADDGRVILKSVDHELSQLIRVLNSFAAVVALKHVQKRLSAYKFELKMEAFLELEMLTTVIVVTYVRLQQGGSGFSRDSIPEQLRSIHDRVVGLRNKRFAHNDEHDTVSNALEVWFEDNRFELKFGLSLGYDIGGRQGVAGPRERRRDPISREDREATRANEAEDQPRMGPPKRSGA
ncbi:hypothetical protein [Bradyrhizobium sp. CCBAU 51765]|uniref:hypothetical protein n=1 Tax=Bradyrhizobium sp. CCBAU 51765 TaxID=1325102 RepID=UPI0018899254|nr:hypothetical protein [Bradyrhizobium sp. CCBAU 51765]QOZ11849.1 hypothetical protein XH96_33700 [Bradyrhizobium sp. CCBAU 51765]